MIVIIIYLFWRFGFNTYGIFRLLWAVIDVHACGLTRKKEGGRVMRREKKIQLTHCFPLSTGKNDKEGWWRMRMKTRNVGREIESGEKGNSAPVFSASSRSQMQFKRCGGCDPTRWRVQTRQQEELEAGTIELCCLLLLSASLGMKTSS